MNIQQLSEKIFTIKSPDSFNETALEIFRYQIQTNSLYNEFVQYLHIKPDKVKSISQIPFLPISFFKNHIVVSRNTTPGHYFESSGTTGMSRSRHYFPSLDLYEKSFFKTFNMFYGQPDEYCILALLPSYLEQKNSSLVYMIEKLIEASHHSKSGFYLNNFDELAVNLRQLDKQAQKTMLIGVSFALLDLIEKHSFDLTNTIIVETGGMKGRRREMVREELHERLSSGFGVRYIHSEYGMTELFSQAWSKGEGHFNTPPWMKIIIRDIHDPLSSVTKKTAGGINIIDLANIHSCSFIATQDLGKLNDDGTIEVLGRFDDAETRGCNLLVAAD